MSPQSRFEVGLWLVTPPALGTWLSLTLSLGPSRPVRPPLVLPRCLLALEPPSVCGATSGGEGDWLLFSETAELP